jgi:hypothetical protein
MVMESKKIIIKSLIRWLSEFGGLQRTIIKMASMMGIHRNPRTNSYPGLNKLLSKKQMQSAWRMKI